MEFVVRRETMRNLAKLETMRIEHDQSRKNLADKREKNAWLVKELEELKLTYGIDIKRCYRAGEN